MFTCFLYGSLRTCWRWRSPQVNDEMQLAEGRGEPFYARLATLNSWSVLATIHHLLALFCICWTQFLLY
jgi:hypothetical protein